MELWTGLITVLVSALRSRLPTALTGIDTDSLEPWSLRIKEENEKNGPLAMKFRMPMLC